MNSSTALDGRLLDQLYALINGRRGADPATSYTARLFDKGAARIAKKTGEEAVEVIIAALSGDRGETVSESADLLYHLLVLWAEAGVRPADVYAELARRDVGAELAAPPPTGGN
jgi:phosphoribosyl-ATP pyrophosphohydrolase